MIRIFFETTSRAPIEKVFDAYVNYQTGQKIIPEISSVAVLKGGPWQPATGSVYAVKEEHGGRGFEYESEFILIEPLKLAEGKAKSKHYTNSFQFKFSGAGEQVKIEAVQEVLLHSAWWWFVQPLLAKSCRDVLRNRVGLINAFLDGSGADKVRLKVFIGRWPLWLTGLILWLALVFTSAVFFQQIRGS